MTGIHWTGVVILVWLVAAGLLLAGWAVWRAPQRRWDAHAESALEVCRERHPSASRWGAGPVPLEDRPEWGTR